jgi:hypothetical protein
MHKKLVVFLLSLSLLFSPMMITGCAKRGTVVNPPDYNAEAYVVKFKLYPDVITIVEMGVTGLMFFEKTQGNTTFSDQVFDACVKAKQVLNAGSFSQAVVEFMNVINKPQFAAGAKIAMDLLTSKLGNVVLTDFDKTVLNGMFDQIASAAASMKSNATSYPQLQEQIVKYGLSQKGN